MKKLTMGSLFAGVGGFEIAGIWAGIEPIWSNEIDKKCCIILRQNFNHRIIEKDIKKLTSDEIEKVDIICGGDPCQPSSRAGLQRGKDDVRYLWPQMFRIIQEKHPTFILNENVDNTITNGILDSKINDLESEGYTCQSYIIPAESVGALHRRDRVWLVAFNPNSHGKMGDSGKISSKSKEEFLQERNKIQYNWEPVNLWPFDTHGHEKRFQEQYIASESSIYQEGLSRYFGFGSAPHGHISRDIIESGIVRMLNGLPEGMDYPERPSRIGMLGNAIIPQVAYEFFRWMVMVYNNKNEYNI